MMLPIALPTTIPLPTTVVPIPPPLYEFSDSTAALWCCRLHCRRRFHCRLPIALPTTIPLPTTVVPIPPLLYDFADSTAAL